MRYVKEFDSLRAFAVIFVLVSHHSFKNDLIHKIPFGAIGVMFFFVLSGYLISSILLGVKETEGVSSKEKLYLFYMRRFLRIFPAYYLFLGLNWLMQNEELAHYPLTYLLYLSNLKFFVMAQYAGALSPTWTLAVEEQFYLIWPFLIIFVNKRFLPHMMLAFIGFSPVFRILTVLVCKSIGQNPAMELALLPSNFLSLCLGAYLAFLHLENKQSVFDRFGFVQPIVYVLIVVGSIFTLKSFAQSLVNQFGITLFSAWVVNYISKRKEPINWLRFSVFQFVGKISYGIYLYHTIAVALVYSLIGNNWVPKFDSELLEFLFNTFIVIAFASLSWFLFEKPINSLKSRYEYKK